MNGTGFANIAVIHRSIIILPNGLFVLRGLMYFDNIFSYYVKDYAIKNIAWFCNVSCPMQSKWL